MVSVVGADECSFDDCVKLLEENAWQTWKAVEWHFHKKSAVNLLEDEPAQSASPGLIAPGPMASTAAVNAGAGGTMTASVVAGGAPNYLAEEEMRDSYVKNLMSYFPGEVKTESQ